MSREPALRPTWLDDERAQPGATAELKRLWRRARRRWLRTLALALLITGAVVAVAARRPRRYESRIAFRVTEGRLEAGSAPRTTGRLRDYVLQVVFSNQHLTSVIKEHGLYPSLMPRDPSLAVEELRDDIHVEVWRNDFAQLRTSEEVARSARLAVTFHGRNAEQVYAVVRHLGRLITESEQSSRLAQAELALRFADEQADQARHLLQDRKREVVEKEFQRLASRTPEAALARLIEARNLEKAIPRAELVLQQAERAREKAYLRTQLERRALGLRWELIDGGRVEPEGMSRRTLLALLAVVAFLVTLPLCAIGVGAFDARVYDLDDVRRLGVRTVGAVRRFDGDNAGALVARLRDEARARIRPS
jgi:uncharacterized protein involved in exopolysaccharide biosynthesis